MIPTKILHTYKAIGLRDIKWDTSGEYIHSAGNKSFTLSVCQSWHIVGHKRELEVMTSACQLACWRINVI